MFVLRPMGKVGDPVVAIVEDEASLLELYADWIEDSWETRTATSGEQALAVIDDDVDIVFVDRRLPESSGSEILHTLRERGNTAQIAMLTAADVDFHILELPLDEYLHKPVSKEAFTDTIEQLLRRSQYEQSLRELHELAAKCAALESAKSPKELDESEEYQQLLVELEAAREAAHAQLEEFEPRDYYGEFKRLLMSA
jgi:DNA-binding response OmpR family regulator